MMGLIDRTISKQIYSLLKERFLRGEFLPGSRIFEDEIAKQYGVSLTPVREAMHRFEAEGLLIRMEHKALCVRTFTIEEARNVYEVRAVLEPFAVELAGKNFDEVWMEKVRELEQEQKCELEKENYPEVQLINYKLHVALAEGSKNPILVELIKRVWVFVPVLRAAAWQYDRSGPHFVADEHAKIVSLLQMNCIEDAVEASREHVWSSWNRVKHALENVLPQLKMEI